MATLKVWTDFTKRKNSTKQPTGGTEIEVKLKENTSIENPVFICNNLGNANYCQYAGNYYFVDDVVFVTNTIVELHCTMDALATNKSAIVGAAAFVKYYTHNNTEISDARLSTKTTKTLLTSVGAFDLLGSSGSRNNAVVVNIVGENSVGSYAMSQDVAKTLTSDFDAWYNNADDPPMPPDPNPFVEIVEGITYFCTQVRYAMKQLLAMRSVPDCIRNAVMLPIPVSAVAGATQEIHIGKFDTDKQGTFISDRIFSDGCDVSIPWQATDWRRNSPYHEIYLYIPYIGLTSISPSDVINEDSIHVSVNMDYTSGDSVFTVYAGSLNHVIAQYNTNLATSFPIGSSNITPVQSGTALLSIAGAVGAAYVSGGASFALAQNSFLGLSNSLSPQPVCVGSACGGAALGLDNNVRCYTVFHDTTVEPSSVSALMGTPFNGVMNIPSSGYVQTVNADIQSVAYGSEKDAINTMLDSGIYIE